MNFQRFASKWEACPQNSKNEGCWVSRHRNSVQLPRMRPSLPVGVEVGAVVLSVALLFLSVLRRKAFLDTTLASCDDMPTPLFSLDKVPHHLSGTTIIVVIAAAAAHDINVVVISQTGSKCVLQARYLQSKFVLRVGFPACSANLSCCGQSCGMYHLSIAGKWV